MDREEGKILIGLVMSYLTVFSVTIYLTRNYGFLLNDYYIYVPSTLSLIYFGAYFIERNLEKTRLMITDKNREILRLYGEGNTMEEIANKLNLAKATVNNEIRNHIKRQFK